MLTRATLFAIVFMGVLLPSMAMPAGNTAENPSENNTERDKIRHSYKKLLSLFPEQRQGYGYDRHKFVWADQPMSYGLILSAEAIRAKNQKAAKDSPEYDESRRRVKQAAKWLLDNADLDRDGKPGWGLPQSWDAWGDGTENPCHQPYTITTAIVLNGLLDALAVPDVFQADERKAIQDTIRDVAVRWCREIWSDGYGGGYFWYSPSKADDIFGINAPTMMLGSLVRVLDEQRDILPAEERKLVSARVHSLAKAVVSTVQPIDGRPDWRYAPLPNHVKNDRPNDLVHHVYILFGIEQYRDWNGAQVKLPWTRSQAIESVDKYLLPEKENRQAVKIMEYTKKDEPQSPQSRLWGAGFMLAFYARWADDARTNRVFQAIEKNYGPMPRQSWVATDSRYKDKDACYHRHNAHVLYGMAIAAFR